MVIPRTMLPEPYRLLAPAKVNLYLEILGQRENGYHDLRSVVVPISLYDKVTLEPTNRAIETVVEKTGLVNGDELCGARSGDNLATKAALALKKATGYPGGVRITLEKNIPVGGGLGGGSADAAAVLTGLNKLWKTELSTDKLMEIGSKVGCDIPAMVYGGAVCMEGLGEKITPIPSSSGQNGDGWWLVVANPGFGVSTRDMYARYRSSLTRNDARFNNIISALKEGNLAGAADSLFNSLQETVFGKYPLVESMVAKLRAAGTMGAMVSGSGSSVFGLVADEEQAHKTAECLVRDLGFPFWSKVARTLPDGVMVAHGPLEA